VSFVQTIAARVGMKRFLKLMSFYPPYVGAGIRMRSIEGNIDAFTLEMKLTPWNKNYMGTHFGGSLYSMCDPWFMFILISKLGKGYVVWDKAARIDFRRPGTGTVSARFHIDEKVVQELKHQLDTVGKVEPVFEVDIFDEAGNIVAHLVKTLHAHNPRLKKKKEQS
jgi:acyl-coenzyme A thioesterase PaaI-like protein